MVKISMETFVRRFQPERYENWLQGKDFGYHPEDPERKMCAAPMPVLDKKLMMWVKGAADVALILIRIFNFSEIQKRGCAPIKMKKKRYGSKQRCPRALKPSFASRQLSLGSWAGAGLELFCLKPRFALSWAPLSAADTQQTKSLIHISF